MNVQSSLEKSALSVTELTFAIKANMESCFAAVWVTGEVSNVSKAQSGHVYFVLKDPTAALPAVMWRSIGLRHKFNLQEGMEVIIRGRITVYPPQGKYQLDVEKLEPKGVGAQEIALRQLRERLLTKGYFDPRRKKKLPSFPHRIALVTSPSGAAIRDMLEVLCNRWTACELIIVPVRVQGEDAASEIASAIRLLNSFCAASGLPIDALIVGRGGGSVEDLWAFNEEIVADAIFSSRIPVISGVGHESDVSICDLVADLHALTPTDAANKVAPDRIALMSTLCEIRNRYDEVIEQRLEYARKKLDGYLSRGVFKRPLERVRLFEERLDDLALRLHRAIKRKMNKADDCLIAISARLESLSPLNVLRRGYTLTRTESSTELVRDVTRIVPGDRLLTTLTGGEIVSRVEEVHPAVSQFPTPSQQLSFGP